MVTALALASGLFWTLTYVLVIRQGLADRTYGMPLVALTRPPGEEPGDLLLARGAMHYAPRYPVEIVDRIGAGDSFVAGLIHGLIEGDFDLAIRLAAYAAAIALATPGDINYFAAEDLAAFHAGTVGGLLR